MITITREPRINESCGQCPLVMDGDSQPIAPPRAVIRIVVFSCFRRAVCESCARMFCAAMTQAGLEVVELLRDLSIHRKISAGLGIPKKVIEP